MGFVGQSSDTGVCIGVWNSNAGAGGNSFSVRRGVHTNEAFDAAQTGIAATIASPVGTFALAEGTTHPANAKALLGWEPKTQLRDGLVKTIAYFDKILSDGMMSAVAGRNSS